VKCGTAAGSSLGGPAGAGRTARGAADEADAGPGFDAEFIDEHLAGALIGGERFGLPSVTVEGEHELGVQAFPERITGDQAPQLGDHVGMTPQVQVGVDACFQCLQPHLGQTGDLPVRQQLRTDIGQRIAPP
jgi:hypothetical protein